MEPLQETQETSSTQISFSEKPTVLEPWLIGHPINRENFTNFLIATYRISRGYQTAQMSLIEYVSHHLDIDLEKVLSDFKDNGGYQSLSNEEQEAIKTAFDQIGLHHHTPLGKPEETEIESMTDDLNSIANSYKQHLMYRHNSSDILEMNAKDFLAFLNEMILKHYQDEARLNTEAHKARQKYLEDLRKK
jgi:hypothetical protein